MGSFLLLSESELMDNNSCSLFPFSAIMGIVCAGKGDSMHMRHTKLLNLVNREKRVSVAGLARELGVSEVTIRKDLTTLEQKGLLRREHGYAVMITSDDIANQLSFNYELKHRIALRAAESVHNGETVMIDSGACCALLAEELATNRRDVTIITNSAFLAAFIHKQPNAHVILLGGEYQNESQVMVGPMVKRCVADFHVDKIFVSADGFTEDGFMSDSLMRAEAIRAMAEHASQVIVLAESATFQSTGVVVAFPPDDVQTLYTDENIDDTFIQKLHESDIHVYTVSMSEEA